MHFTFFTIDITTSVFIYSQDNLKSVLTDGSILPITRATGSSCHLEQLTFSHTS